MNSDKDIAEQFDRVLSKTDPSEDVFRAAIKTFDANGSMKADRKLPFVTVETLLDHIKLVIQQHRDWSTKMLISIDFPTTPQQVEKLDEDI